MVSEQNGHVEEFGLDLWFYGFVGTILGTLMGAIWLPLLSIAVVSGMIMCAGMLIALYVCGVMIHPDT